MGRILVTGDAGFIGYHLTSSLLDEGHNVLGLDSMNNYYDPQLKRDRLSRLVGRQGFTHATGEVEDEEFITRLIDDFEPEVVVHLAAQAGVRYSLENPRAYVMSNVLGTQVLLGALKDSGVHHVMLASTSSAYGGTKVLPFSETVPTQSPVSLYAATKIASEAIAHSYSHLYQLPVTCFRFFTVYGPWGRPDMALFKFVRAVREGEAIDIYGFGKMRRDFTYIDDLIYAIKSLFDHAPVVGEPVSPDDSLSPVAPFRIVNIGGGAPTALLDFVGAIESALGVEAIKNFLPMQPGDVVETFADNRLMRSLIGEVESTPVKVGVERFVDWFDAYHSADRSARDGLIDASGV
ncbi:NAD-dependent epimerase/dehydratase family protein [Microbacterium sp. NPDC091313]